MKNHVQPSLTTFAIYSFIPKILHQSWIHLLLLTSSPIAPILPLLWTMVPSKKCKHTHIKIQSNIPLQSDDIVMCVKVAQKTKQGVCIKTSQVSVPVTNPPPSEDIPLEASDPIPPIPNDPLSHKKKGWKGTSCSVTVCFNLNPSPILPVLIPEHIV